MLLRRQTRLALTLGLIALPFGLASQPAAAQFSPDDLKALTEIVEKGIADQRQPGLNVGIWIPGRGDWVASFGKADIKTGTPMKVGDHVRIASVTKSFTGVATLLLVDQGKLSLEDKLSRFIKGIPNGDIITIRNLLGMTSGIYDFSSDEQFLKDFTANPSMPFSSDDMIAIVKRHQPDFAPGEKVVYCDTNFAFLGVIIEKVTGKPAGVVIEELILQPLKLADTSYPTTTSMPEPYSRGYYAGEDGEGEFVDYTAVNPAITSSAGAMISSLDDLRIWAKTLATGALLKPQTHAEQIKFGVMVKTPVVTVSYGLGIANFGGLIGHNGAIFGYTTAMFYVPEFDATLVLEGNQSSNSSSATTLIAIDLAKYLFPDLIK
jgi:D-alanyl-D-alanine carboxypeptidase